MMLGDRVTLWKGRVRWPKERAICEVLAGLHLSAAYVYGLLRWPFATILVAALYFMVVLHSLAEGD